MSLLDWAIVVGAIVALRYVSLSTRSHMKGVADFLSANRLAGRYLLTIAQDMGGTGAISFLALWEIWREAGFSQIWWGTFLIIPLTPILLLTGWVYYRYRETRALTLAQLFEMRYTKNFRITAGMICWACGVVNFGIFPAVAARFFVYFCGLPAYFQIPGIPIDINTFLVVMALDLILALAFVMMGGQISIMVTECVQGMFTAFAFLLIAGYLLLRFRWPDIFTALQHTGADTSFVNPFHATGAKNFNTYYFLMGIVMGVYAYQSWQGTSGFNSSAKSPHEQKMGMMLAMFRQWPSTVLIAMTAICAIAVMDPKMTQFASIAAKANFTLNGVSTEYLKNQMMVPAALAAILPIGLKGIFATAMLFFSFTCHDSYMHAWGTIFIQDVVMPIREKLRKPRLAPEEHIRMLRWSILFVAVFSFVWGWLYPQTVPIWMFFSITGTMWAGAGAVIIGGLYTRVGNTAGAFAAIIAGPLIGIPGLFQTQITENLHPLITNDLWMHSTNILVKYITLGLYYFFSLNGRTIGFLASICALIIYFVVSWATGGRRNSFNLERMLRRGQYKRADMDSVEEHKISKWMAIIGITREFSRTDRIIAFTVIGWNASWFLVFLLGTLKTLFLGGFSDAAWGKLWHFWIWVQFLPAIPTTIWLTVGGILDIRSLSRHLSTAIRDHTDDGHVADGPVKEPLSSAYPMQMDLQKSEQVSEESK